MIRLALPVKKAHKFGGHPVAPVASEDMPDDDDGYIAVQDDDDDSAADSIMEGYGAGLGRPTKYRRNWDKVARNMRLAGFTVKDIAVALGVEAVTLTLWRQTYPSFDAAWQCGGEIADGRVARAMFKRAIGYKHPAVKIFNSKDTGIVEAPYTEHYPPDTSAGIFWLTNRQKTLWKSVTSTALTGADGKDLPSVPPSINVMVIQHARRQAAALIDQSGAEVVEPAGV